MASPSSSLATQRPDLAESFTEYDLEMNMRGFIGQRVLPVVDVGSQAGNFGRIPLEQLLVNSDTARAPGSGYSRGKWTFEPATYACLENGHEEAVDDREAKMFSEYFVAEQVSTMRAYSAVLTNQEKRIADLIFNATTWTGSALTTAVTNEWDDATNATPIDDVEAAIQKVYDGSGLWPNSLIINHKVFRNLRNCDQIIERIASSGAGDATKATDITEAMLAQVFDLPKIIVGGSSKNTAQEGQDASISQIWSDEYAMVCTTSDSIDFRTPCVGRTFHWAEDGSSIGGTVETYRDETIRGDVVRVRHDTDELVLYAEAGHLLSNITT